MSDRPDDTSLLFGSRSSDVRKSHRNDGGRRLVRKNGRSEIIRIQPSDIMDGYERSTNLVHSLIDADWKWTLSVLIMTFIFTWFFFALLWMVIGFGNNDQDELASVQCLIGIGNFSGYLLFSIETQTSVGYGSRSITQNCVEAIILVCIQILIGVGLGGSIVSIVYAKMISPKTQHADRCFTKNAVICQRDGNLCLIFRTRDPSAKYGFQNNIKAFLIKMRDGECLLKSIELESTGMIIWPTEIVHKITKTSPFRDLSAKDLVSRRFEIIVIMEGTSLSTNQSSRTVTSYLSNEILWGHTFRSCVKFDKTKMSYRVSHKRFNSTIEVETPLCSAQRLSEVYSEFLSCQIDSERSEGVQDSPNGSEQRKSISPESGIVVSPISNRSFFNEDYESSEFSSLSSSDEEEEKERISKFQIRKRSSILVSSLLESLQKYVYSDVRKNSTAATTILPLETSL
ncbi:hypothetical protein HHI36_003563 [Cryptolaemus montrouzieri]|uniref:Uncharacterized protein n=1 Tax=Cryptolaemus montrouzieri TaxID=559131 RepID=A0ABD2PE05_9CUCU